MKNDDSRSRSRSMCCLYHDQKVDFHTALSTLKKWVGIPKNLVPRVAMAICSCRRKTQYRKTIAEVSILNEEEAICDQQLLQQLSLKETTKVTSSSIATLKYVSDAITDKNVGNESALRFVLVLKMALRNAFVLLQEEKTSNRKACLIPLVHEDNKSKNVELPPSATGNKQCSAKGFRSIIKKRKRQADKMFTCLLPVFGGEFRNLFNDREIGRDFATLSVKFKPCVIELDFKATGDKMNKNLKQTVIKVWCKRIHLPFIQRVLSEKAAAIQKAHEGNFIREKQRRMQYLRQHHDEEPNKARDIINALFQIKDNRQDNYTRKQVCSRKNKMSVAARDKGKSVKCYNCHIEQNVMLKKYNSAPEKIHPSLACRYHPGFVDKEKRWSCCQEDVDTSQTSSEQHCRNGCSQGPHHWRYQVTKCSNEIDHWKHLQQSICYV